MEIKSGLMGMYKLEAVTLDDDGVEVSRRTLADWFPNLILDAGLERLVLDKYMQYCQVGTGNTAPAVTDTALQTRIAGTSTQQAGAAGVQGSAPYYAWLRTTYRFAAGTAAGNISEVGVGWASNGSLFSRALVLDGSSNPTTITVLSTEVLDVTYELRVYPPLSDVTGSITIAGVSYNYTLRACNVTTGVTALGSQPGWGLDSGNGWYWGADDAFHSTKAYDGAIGTIVQSPSGNNLGDGNGTAQAYVANSRQRDYVLSYGLNTGNSVGGIKSIRWGSLRSAYQIEFTPNIPKTASKTLNLTVRHSWGRL